MEKNTSYQLSLLDRHQESSGYHQTGTGYFAILTGTRYGKKSQRCYKLTDMPNVLAMVDPTRDAWMSQAEFILPNRRVVNLARIGLLFSDLDYYRMPNMQGLPPESIADQLLYHCQEHLTLPVPSIIVASGQGLQAKWLINGTLPRQALPRWNACQRHLTDQLKDFGADPMARDASRVLRLVDTVNTKNGQQCRVVNVTTGEDGQPVRYDFEWLCEQLLPVARWDIEEQQEERKRKKSKLKLVINDQIKGLKKGSSRQLAWHRLEDLRKLVQLRGGVPEGERMNTLFWHLNFLLLSGATNHYQMWHEAKELARQIDPDWTYKSAELSTLYQKAKDMNQGKTVIFNGNEYSALYTPWNSTLIDRFQMTDDEIRQMKTVISKAEKKRRKAARNKAASDWKMSRAEYLDQAKDRRQRAVQLKSQGFKYKYIAEQLEISVAHVKSYFQTKSRKW